MFEATFPKARELKKIIAAIKDLCSDANFDCASSGISMQAMDGSHVALVELFLDAEEFKQFRCDRSVTLGLSLGSVDTILKCAADADRVAIKADDDGETCTFLIENEAQTRSSEFGLNLLNIDSDHLGIPDTEYSCIVNIPSSEFGRVCKELALIGDTIRISVPNEEKVVFSSAGEKGNGKITFNASQGKLAEREDDSSETVSIECTSGASFEYATRYLVAFTKAAPLSHLVTLKLNPEAPLVVQYDIPNLGQIRYFLAPKIADE